MTPEIIVGLVRSVLMVLSASLLTKGVIDSNTIDQIAGALSVIIIAAFSVRAKLKAKEKLEAAKSAASNGNTPTPPTQ